MCSGQPDLESIMRDSSRAGPPEERAEASRRHTERSTQRHSPGQEQPARQRGLHSRKASIRNNNLPDREVYTVEEPWSGTTCQAERSTQRNSQHQEQPARQRGLHSGTALAGNNLPGRKVYTAAQPWPGTTCQAERSTQQNSQHQEQPARQKGLHSRTALARNNLSGGEVYTAAQPSPGTTCQAERSTQQNSQYQEQPGKPLAQGSHGDNGE